MEIFEGSFSGAEALITGEVTRIHEHLRSNLGRYRYEHSLLTVKNGLYLARKSHLGDQDTYRVMIACLAHDITKEMPASFHAEIFDRHKVEYKGIIPGPVQHAWSAPYYLGETFGISDMAILHAIKYHTTGCGDMPVVSRITFAADFLSSPATTAEEPGRDDPLNAICLEKTITAIETVVGKKMPVQTDSINFYNTLVREAHHETVRG